MDNHPTLNTACYTIQDGKIVTGKLADFDQYIETTTRPTGIGPKYYVVSTSDGKYHLAYWMTWNGPQRITETFETLAKAERAAEKTYVQDILTNQEIPIFLELSDAEKCLAEEAGE